jgi:hypothetical protein
MWYTREPQQHAARVREREHQPVGVSILSLDTRLHVIIIKFALSSITRACTRSAAGRNDYTQSIQVHTPTYVHLPFLITHTAVVGVIVRRSGWVSGAESGVFQDQRNTRGVEIWKIKPIQMPPRNETRWDFALFAHRFSPSSDISYPLLPVSAAQWPDFIYPCKLSWNPLRSWKNYQYL